MIREHQSLFLGTSPAVAPLELRFEFVYLVIISELRFFFEPVGTNALWDLLINRW